ncbi:MAG: aminopeptidase [Lachnospiraceae bacterium]
MKYLEIYREENEAASERFELSMERIRELASESSDAGAFADYFRKTAAFIVMMEDVLCKTQSGWMNSASETELKLLNQKLYEDILGEHYESSYANPVFAVKMLGEGYGQLLSFVYSEIRGMIVYAFEGRVLDMTILNELLLQIYTCFGEEVPSYEELKDIVYWHMSDYCDIKMEQRVRDMVDPEMSFARDIICGEDLTNTRYLYLFGEYISESELKVCRFLNTLPEEKILKMAETFTEGYRMGFEKAGIDLSKKKTVNIRYSLGFERVVREAVRLFEEMGLQSVIYRSAESSFHKNQTLKIGYYGAIANKQYDYDHKEDQALYLDKAFVERKLGAMRYAYEQQKNPAGVHAGPAVMEVFGETPFVPVSKPEAARLSEKQQSLMVHYNNAAGQITNEYIPGDERSFTIIAFPVPEIGDLFEEIFEETVKINTLDYHLYETIQQTLIDALDEGEAVHITGKGENCTDLLVKLHPLKDPAKETAFENCVADVNIPVGEVFTSPVLEGTEGILHVSQVYLNDLRYTDLKVSFRDGMVSDYSCGNFEDPEEGRKYFLENVLYHHSTLPLGEFAIGTNTTAYMMAEKYRIVHKLPILIAEKMGPHFALGDTCYSFAEEQRLYNPDGREIVAKDNSCSILRKEDPSRAYFNCHTDITIPYDELGMIEVVKADGSRTPIFAEGRFCLPGTEELNRPFDE